jgi:predicted ATPase/class 3 adenylate cyclase
VPTRAAWHPRSFVLTDIVGSVALWERDPDAMAEAVARHEDLIREAIAAAGGNVVRTRGEGDSTFSVFDHPAEAVAGAGAVQAAIGGERWSGGVALRIRCGVHTGEAEPRHGDWYGPAVNRAARLRGLAGPGQALVSGVTAGLAADRLPRDLRLVYRGRRVLRGIERPEEVWDLVTADDPRGARPTSAVGNMPVPLTSFVGRAAELVGLAGVLEGRRLVTLTGVGGSGKTRLALAAAAQTAARGEPVWTVELAPLSDPRSVAAAVAATVGIEPGADPLADLRARPEALAGLLVLDNCEHLVDACASVARAALAAAPDLQILATSRTPLGVAGEQVWPLGPLGTADSIELLLDRARAVRPDLTIGAGDEPVLAHLCRALDGLPLAIELAAGRLRSMSLTALAAHLDNQLAVLARPAVAGDEARHRTMRMAFDTSYDLLTDQQQAVAQRLSVFAGGFRLDAAEIICGGLDALDTVDELVAKSLLTFDGTTARYRLLEPLRHYLAERLAASGAGDETRRVHAEWVADLATQLGRRLLDDQRANSRRLRAEAGNIDLALHWAQDHDHDLALRIVAALGQYWFTYDQATGRRWSAPIVAADQGSPTRLRARALLGAAMVAQNDVAWDQSIDLLGSAMATYRADEHLAGQAACLFLLGRAHGSQPGGRRRAVECFTEAARLYTQIGDVMGAGWCGVFLSTDAYMRGEMEHADRLAVDVVRRCETAGVRHPVGQALHVRAHIARHVGDDASARRHLQQAAALYSDLDDPWQLADVLSDLAAVNVSLGRGDAALDELATASELIDEVGRLPGRSVVLAFAAVVYQVRGETARALAAMGAYDAHPAVGADRIRAWSPSPTNALGWLADDIDATRAQFAPDDLDRAIDSARRKSVDQLIDELILQPARSGISRESR